MRARNSSRAFDPESNVGYLTFMALFRHIFVRSEAARWIQGLLLVSLLSFAAGIPMATFMCGTDGSRTVCTMPDCDTRGHEDPREAVRSPDCCTVLTIRSEPASAVKAETEIAFPMFPLSEISVTTDVCISNNLTITQDILPAVDSPPLYVQHCSFLI